MGRETQNHFINWIHEGIEHIKPQKRRPKDKIIDFFKYLKSQHVEGACVCVTTVRETILKLPGSHISTKYKKATSKESKLTILEVMPWKSQHPAVTGI